MTKRKTQGSDLGNMLMQMESLATDARKAYAVRTEDQLRGILDEIVEGYAKNNVGHPAALGIARNTAVMVLADHLNKMQKRQTFEDEYTVTYVKKVRPTDYY